MLFRTVFLSGLALLSSAIETRAQIASEDMNDLSVWSTRYLPAGAREFSPHLWSGSDFRDLLGLMQPVHPQNLTPLERALLRRLILSPARPPEGETAGALHSERARLMLELGELHAAADFMAGSDIDLPTNHDHQISAIDLALAEGQGSALCAQHSAIQPQTKTYPMKHRIVCMLLQDNYRAAELATELAVADGIDDPWFIAAVFAASSDMPTRPAARFDSGLHIALSIKADLDSRAMKPAHINPGLAALAIHHPGIRPELKARLARRANRFGLISRELHRALLLYMFTNEEYEPVTRVEKTLHALSDPALDPGVKAHRLNGTLTRALQYRLKGYQALARWFLPDLQNIPQTRQTSPYALEFARAALMAGDTVLAGEWLMQLQRKPPPSPEEINPDERGYSNDQTGVSYSGPGIDGPGETGIDNKAKGADSAPFDLVMLGALGAVPRDGRQSIPGNLSAIANQLIETADTPERLQQAARILTIWSAFDLPLNSRSRAFVSAFPDSGRRIAPGRITALDNAGRNQAIAETALRVLAEIEGRPDMLSNADLGVLIRALRQIGASDIAFDLALEATMMVDTPQTARPNQENTEPEGNAEPARLSPEG